MPLTLYYHPLASFCWKALIALYENDTPLEPVIVDLGDERSRAEFAEVWPLLRFPVIRDGERLVAEATTIIEYLDTFYPGPSRLSRQTDRAAFLRARAGGGRALLPLLSHRAEAADDPSPALTPLS